jgi:hypothetical protein
MTPAAAAIEECESKGNGAAAALVAAAAKT